MKVEIAATFAAAPAPIWESMVASRQMVQWFCKEATFDARVGKPYRVVLPGKADVPETITGRVLAWVPEVRLSLSVTGAHLAGETTVTLFLASQGDGSTKLMIVHDGFKRLPSKIRTEAAEAAERFWRTTIAQLATHLGVAVQEAATPVAAK
jgi:uncharacterized protein YndB with AHSA1/START domain